ncbi:MAG: CNP1-like family protein [Azoarcus sp.]|jgi:hypothetical protein|nr:CNP1-like family protein [Azoarcus sp.]
MARLVLWLVFLLTPGIAAAQASPDDDDGELDDPAWREADHVLPAVPDEQNLRAFELSPPSANRFLLDAASLSVGADGVIRYTLVVQARGGARNVTFEGVRCETSERRIYASMDKDGHWRPFEHSAWAPIRAAGANNPRATLASRFFCDSKVHESSVERILGRMRGDIDFIGGMSAP